MADYLLLENGSYLLKADGQPLLLESSLVNQLQNFMFPGAINSSDTLSK